MMHDDRLAQVRRTMDLLFKAIGDLKQDGLVPTEKIEMGYLLWEMIRLAGQHLDPLKEELRQEALEEIGNETGPVYFKGTRKTACRVIVSKSRLQLRAEIGIDHLIASLGVHFPYLFEKDVTYKPNSAAIRKLIQNPEGREDVLQTVVEAISHVDMTPRVKFSRDS